MKILKKISLKDILGIFIFAILVIPAFIRKHILKKEIWLISEHLTARDNGYFFFKYMRENHPEIGCYYAVDYNHNDYDKVKELGNTVKWGSIKHYYYYMSSKWNISSHKNGSPNHILFTGLRLYLNLYNNFVFLQHGVLYQNFEMFHAKNSHFSIFICGAKPEYEFVKKKFGYKCGEVRYTGLARFDTLHKYITKKRIVLYVPTWRKYLVENDILQESDYFKKIESFINSKELDMVLDKYNFELHFCPHNGLKNGMKLFKTKNKNVKIIDITKADVQKMLIESEVLITDFSSIHTDFAYMKKPILYYQYDEEDYFKKHVGQGYKDTYYDFNNDGFGPVIRDEKQLIKEIQYIISKNEIEIKKEYEIRINNFFELNDSNNCERIYEEIMRG